MRTVIGLIRNTLSIAALAGLVACQAADGTSQAPDTALVTGLMKGLGAVDPNEKPIDYKPRAPLAMPSEPSKLPAPETNVAGTNDANWPKPQENKDLQEIKAIYADQSGVSSSDQLTPAQRRGFTITGVTGQKERDLAAETRQLEIDEGGALTREEQQANYQKVQALKAQQSAAAGARRYLIEPPAEYSTPAEGVPTGTEQQDPRCLEGQKEYCN